MPRWRRLMGEIEKIKPKDLRNIVGNIYLNEAGFFYKE